MPSVLALMVGQLFGGPCFAILEASTLWTDMDGLGALSPHMGPQGPEREVGLRLGCL